MRPNLTFLRLYSVQYGTVGCMRGEVFWYMGMGEVTLLVSFTFSVTAKLWDITLMLKNCAKSTTRTYVWSYEGICPRGLCQSKNFPHQITYVPIKQLLRSMLQDITPNH